MKLFGPEAARLQLALCEALGVDIALVNRIVIDVDYNSVQVYIQQYADERLLNINWAGNLKETTISSTEKPT